MFTYTKFILSLIIPVFVLISHTEPLRYRLNASFLLLKDGDNATQKYYSLYNITENIPQLFEGIYPLNLDPLSGILPDEDMAYSNTSKALYCYKSLPRYSLIRGIVKEYSYFLSIFYKLKCEHNHEYHDGSSCGDTLYLIDLLENRADILKEDIVKKRNECFKYEVNIVSVQSRFFNNTDFVGRQNWFIDENEFLMIERSYLLRTITQFETEYTKISVNYEKYCISGLDYTGSEKLDCNLWRLQCWLLEDELMLLSEEYFKRLSRFNRLLNYID